MRFYTQGGRPQKAGHKSESRTGKQGLKFPQMQVSLGFKASVSKGEKGMHGITYPVQSKSLGPDYWIIDTKIIRYLNDQRRQMSRTQAR